MSQFLSDLTYYRTYAETKADGTKETWDECVARYETFISKRYPKLEPLIHSACDDVRAKRCVPSMRLLQFAGRAAELSHARSYNCAVVAMDDVTAFGEFVWLLMNGCGVGYSIQIGHIKKLPVVPVAKSGVYFKISDTREGWADSLKVLVKNPGVVFDYTSIRPEGARISTGGTASGPGVLRESLEKIREILVVAEGRKLSAREISDILCIAASFVFVGGVRRAACIALFSPEDPSMYRYKGAGWWEAYPYRAFANVSAVFNPETVEWQDFKISMADCFEGGSGEPGVVMLTSSLEYGLNPCCEISLRYQSFCNLTEVVAPNCKTEQEFTNAVISATVLGSLQAGLTDFTYLRPIWRENCRKDSLLGVSITGQAQVWDKLQEWIPAAVGYVKPVNALVADLIGTRPAARITTVKPSGTTSAVLGCTSGIHAAHAPFYIRNIRITKTNPVAQALMTHCATSPMLADEGDQICVSVPVKMEGIYQDDETAVDLLERARWVRENWIAPGHRDGENMHNVSLTCYYRPEEKEDVADWMWDYRYNYTGVALFPKTETHYVRLPFESVTAEEWAEKDRVFQRDFGDFDFQDVKWGGVDERRGELACSGGKCEI